MGLILIGRFPEWRHSINYPQNERDPMRNSAIPPLLVPRPIRILLRGPYGVLLFYGAGKMQPIFHPLARWYHPPEWRLGSLSPGPIRTHPVRPILVMDSYRNISRSPDGPLGWSHMGLEGDRLYSLLPRSGPLFPLRARRRDEILDLPPVCSSSTPNLANTSRIRAIWN